MVDQKKENSAPAIPSRLRRLYELIDSSLLEFGSLEPRQKAIMVLAKELSVDKAQMQELVNRARANHPQINAVARIHTLIKNAKAEGKKPDLSMFRRLQPAARSAGKDDMWLGAQLGYIPAFIEEAAQLKAAPKNKSRALPITLGTIVVLALVGGFVWQSTYGGLLSEQNAQREVDSAAWAEAQELYSPEGFNSYLRNHPGGLYADQAKQQLSELDELAWAQAQELNTRRAYESYLSQFNSRGSEALVLMDQLLPGDNFRDCIGCPEMMVVPAGVYQMGSNQGESDEQPVHQVSIERPFAVGILELTFAEWDVCVVKNGCDQDIYDGGWGRNNRPLVNVSWDDAQQYLNWLSGESGETYRLLSEAEWEYINRSGSDAEYWWGDYFVLNRAVCEGCETDWLAEKTEEVGKYPANPFGLKDTTGNVAELVADCWHPDYSGAPGNGSAWLNESAGDCTQAVTRGGSWLNGPSFMRSASRAKSDRNARDMSVGFRVARDID